MNFFRTTILSSKPRWSVFLVKPRYLNMLRCILIIHNLSTFAVRCVTNRNRAAQHFFLNLPLTFSLSVYRLTILMLRSASRQPVQRHCCVVWRPISKLSAWTLLVVSKTAFRVSLHAFPPYSTGPSKQVNGITWTDKLYLHTSDCTCAYYEQLLIRSIKISGGIFQKSHLSLRIHTLLSFIRTHI